MPKHPVRDDIDLLDGDWYATEPHDDWAWMREHAPVYYDAKSDVWAHHPLRRRARHREGRQGRSRATGRPRPHGDAAADDDLDGRPRAPAAPVARVAAGSRPSGCAEHEATIRRICNEIIDRVVRAGECDFVWDIAAPLPLLLIADMLGFEPSAYDDLLRWSDDLIRATTVGPDRRRSARRGMEAMLGFREFQLGVIADRRSKPPQDDLISIALPRRDRRRAARRRVDHPGDACSSSSAATRRPAT